MGSNTAQIEVFPSPAEVARAAADRFLAAYQEAVLSRRWFIVALSGGSTPKLLHALLAASPYLESIDWARVFVAFGDERYVPPTDDQSNEKMARETLLSHIPIPEAHVFPMYQAGGVEEAAAAYESCMEDLVGFEGPDLTLLGIGPDGHTASLFPGRPSVHVTDRLVIAAKANAGVEDRITMTVPMLNRSREILFLVAGADKADAAYRAIKGPENWDQTPSQAVGRHAPNVHWLLDEAAAAKLE